MGKKTRPNNPCPKKTNLILKTELLKIRTRKKIYQEIKKIETDIPGKQTKTGWDSNLNIWQNGNWCKKQHKRQRRISSASWGENKQNDIAIMNIKATSNSFKTHQATTDRTAGRNT